MTMTKSPSGARVSAPTIPEEMTPEVVTELVFAGQADRKWIERGAPRWRWSNYELRVVRRKVTRGATVGRVLARTDQERQYFRDLIAEFQGLGEAA